MLAFVQFFPGHDCYVCDKAFLEIGIDVKEEMHQFVDTVDRNSTVLYEDYHTVVAFVGGVQVL